MSFSSDIKERLTTAKFVCPRCAAHEAAGALMFGGTVSDTKIKFTTENKSVAARVKSDIEEAFGISLDITETPHAFRIETDDIHKVLNISGGIPQGGGIPFSCCRAAFVRGAFLGNQVAVIRSLFKVLGFNGSLFLSFQFGYFVFQLGYGRRYYNIAQMNVGTGFV